MKQFLLMLFFFGITTTGFAQWSVTITGSLRLEDAGENRIRIQCAGDGTCIRLSGAPNGGVRVEVPELQIDETIGGVQVNGVPAEALPSEIPGNGELYLIEMIPFDDI